MSRGFLIVLLCGSTCFCEVYTTKHRLTISGLASIDVGTEGWSSAGVIPAVEVALERINNESDLLQNYTLVVEWKDSKCSSGHAIKSLVELISEPPHKIAVLGPPCSLGATPVAQALSSWNLVQFGYSATDTSLLNKDKYPNFFMINPAGTVYDPGIVSLLDYFAWKTLSIVNDGSEIASSSTEHLERVLIKHKKKIEVIGFVNNATSAIDRLKRHDARILIFQMYEDSARDFICSAFHGKFYGDSIVFLIQGWFAAKWWTKPHNTCSLQQMTTVVRNVLLIDLRRFGNEQTPVLGLTRSGFEMQYEKFLRKKNSKLYTANKYATYAFDATFILAVVLNKTEEKLRTMDTSLREFNYSRSDITKVMKDVINKTDIYGLSGQIKLNSKTTRYVNLVLQQLQDYEVKDIATYFPSNNSISLLPEKQFVWPGGRVPACAQTKRRVLVCVSQKTFIALTCLAFCCILVALFFLWINTKNRNKEYLKMSCPPLNNFLILGCIISYFCVPLDGLNSCGIANSFNLGFVCKVHGFLITTAFSLTFGTIFVKTWRVYRIFTNERLSKNLRFLSNKHLEAMVMVMVLLDILYFLAWNIVSPLSDTFVDLRTDHVFTHRIVYYTHQCIGSHYDYWFYGIAGSKVILVVFGLFLTWETRNVQYPGLNDSKYIALCVYNMVIFLIAMAPIQFFVRNVNHKFTVMSLIMILCTSVTLLLMFIPKILGHEPRGVEPAEKTGPTALGSFSIATNSKGSSSSINFCQSCKQQFDDITKEK